MWTVRTTELLKLTQWIGRAKMSRFRKNVMVAVIAGLVYGVWEARNQSLWHGKLGSSRKVIDELKWRIKNRITLLLPKKLAHKDKEWFLAL